MPARANTHRSPRRARPSPGSAEAGGHALPAPCEAAPDKVLNGSFVLAARAFPRGGPFPNIAPDVGRGRSALSRLPADSYFSAISAKAPSEKTLPPRTYTGMVSRPADGNTALSGPVVSAGPLVKKFDPTVLAYSVAAPNESTTVTFTPTGGSTTPFIMVIFYRVGRRF